MKSSWLMMDLQMALIKTKQLHPATIEMRSIFGQTSALDAAIKASKYPYLVAMDADLQNDPADVTALIRHLGK
jgi:hypothetical protein